jgi:hypothetical protein
LVPFTAGLEGRKVSVCSDRPVWLKLFSGLSAIAIWLLLPLFLSRLYDETTPRLLTIRTYTGKNGYILDLSRAWNQVSDPKMLEWTHADVIFENNRGGGFFLTIVPNTKAASTLAPQQLVQSLRTSLPVTGSLATEIFSGPGFAGGLRVPTREVV